MAILETNDDGSLHVPAELLGGARAHTEFELEVSGNKVQLRPVRKPPPFWRTATPQQRSEAFQRWANAPRLAAPDLSDESLRRENLYD